MRKKYFEGDVPLDVVVSTSKDDEDVVSLWSGDTVASTREDNPSLTTTTTKSRTITDQHEATTTTTKTPVRQKSRSTRSLTRDDDDDNDDDDEDERMNLVFEASFDVGRASKTSSLPKRVWAALSSRRPRRLRLCGRSDIANHVVAATLPPQPPQPQLEDDASSSRTTTPPVLSRMRDYDFYDVMTPKKKT